MGGSFYNSDSRSIRAKASGFYTHTDAAFTQQKEGKVHESMNPVALKLRECRDSENHPFTIPIIAGLDVTGSMRTIPKEMIKDGLPTMMSTLIQKGLPDAAVCFLGIGDHEYDRGPLQVGQFESGDVELDLWLTRTWLEGGGGGNRGESYQLAWFFAARHTVTDAWEKRKQKGFLFTIGDEPCLPNLPGNAIKGLTGEVAETVTTEQLLKEAQEKWNIFHIVITHSQGAMNSVAGWKELLGQNVIEVSDHTKVASKIAEIVLSHTETPHTETSTSGEGIKTNIVL